MALVTRELKASYAFIERNFNLTKRYWGWEVAWLIYSVAGALAVSLIGKAEGNDRLLLTLVIGAIFWSYLSIVFEFIAEAVQWERWEGTLEYTFMAPVRRYAVRPVARPAKRVVILQGCVQRGATPNVNRALEYLLSLHDIAFQYVAGEGCCGAVDLHLSAHDVAERRMKNLIDKLMPLAESVMAGKTRLSPVRDDEIGSRR